MTLPAEFSERTCALLGEEEYEKLVAALAEEAAVSIRLNPWKCNASVNSLSAAHYESVPWCADGYYLDERLTFTFDPLFHAGCYYVQEASSMFLEQVFKQHVANPVLMLDLCAAPGGKSTHARSILPDGSLLVSNEVIRNRSQILSENMIKWGHPDVMVTQNDPSDFKKLHHLFDVILADVPCSGEGMFRKDPGAIDEWSLENVEICRQRQWRIISDIWPSLKPGGILIYSTCTYNLEENEENIFRIINELGASPLAVKHAPEWNITGNLSGKDFPVYRFLPHKTRGEGFFLAVLRKEETEDITSARSVHVEALLEKHLRVVHSFGVASGVKKGKDLIPPHALAMSKTLDLTSYPVCELTYEQAIAYLRREVLNLNPNTPRGYVLVTYKGVTLGFVKNIGNRANNLYPQEWRIRSGYLPDKIKTL